MAAEPAGLCLLHISTRMHIKSERVASTATCYACFAKVNGLCDDAIDGPAGKPLGSNGHLAKRDVGHRRVLRCPATAGAVDADGAGDATSVSSLMMTSEAAVKV